MRRKILILSLLLCCLCTAAAGTHAYFTVSAKAVNVVTAGNIRIALQSQWESAPVMPGTEITSAPRVENVGDFPAFIRVRVEKEIRDCEPEIPDPELVQPQWNSSCWIFRDGYYYYDRALGPGSVTEPLFTAVRFLPEMGNDYQGSSALLRLQVQAVQTAHNGTDALSAAGWPE